MFHFLRPLFLPQRGIDHSTYFMTIHLFDRYQRQSKSYAKAPKRRKDYINMQPFLILRSRADSNRCRSFCRAQPNRSATRPTMICLINLITMNLVIKISDAKIRHPGGKQRCAAIWFGVFTNFKPCLLGPSKKSTGL